jgi:hypothetical protein
MLQIQLKVASRLGRRIGATAMSVHQPKTMAPYGIRVGMETDYPVVPPPRRILGRNRSVVEQSRAGQGAESPQL